MPASSLHLDMLFLSGIYLLKRKLFQICNLFLGIKNPPSGGGTSCGFRLQSRVAQNLRTIGATIRETEQVPYRPIAPEF